MDDEKATPDDYITGLKNALRFHQSQVNKYNLAIHAFEEGYKAGVTVANDNQKLASEKKHMTNREWLASLSDGQLAEFLYGLEDYAHCEFCADDGKCHNSNTIVQNCLGGLEKWLKQEHKE